MLVTAIDKVWPCRNSWFTLLFLRKCHDLSYIPKETCGFLKILNVESGDISQSVNCLLCKLEDLSQSQHPQKSWGQWWASITPALKGEKKQLDSWSSLAKHPSQLVGKSNERPNLKSNMEKDGRMHLTLTSGPCVHIFTYMNSICITYAYREWEREKMLGIINKLHNYSLLILCQSSSVTVNF